MLSQYWVDINSDSTHKITEIKVNTVAISATVFTFISQYIHFHGNIHPQYYRVL